MVFSNAIFLFVFLPIVLLGYYLLRGRMRNYWLLLTSIIFYAWNKPEFTVILLLSIVVNFISALAIENLKGIAMKRMALILSIFTNIGILFYFKYFNFAISVINKMFSANFQFAFVILPIGISFFTFQGLSYVIDVYKRDVQAQRNIFKLGMYISMFPQLVAGPIVRYKDIALEIDNRKVEYTDFVYGIQRFIVGLFKKVLIADTLAIPVNSIFGMDPIQNSIVVAWFGVICYAMQIFFDFSGYSDMAIGLGRMFGFHFMENFNYPYISKSITEFWRRWHISLSTFFRDYIYIPLGGNRRHVYINVAVVFILTGIWHGAAFTYILWGIWHGFFNIMEKVFRKKGDKEYSIKAIRVQNVLKHFYTLFIVGIGWVIFRASGIKHAIKYILSLFGLWNTDFPPITLRWYLDKWTLVILVLAIIMSTRLLKNIYEFVKRRVCEQVLVPLKYIILLGAFMLCVLQIASNSYSAFIYFQF